MLRRVALVSFALAVTFVVACGHQVTPEPNLANSNLAGRVVIHFRTNGQLNFNAYTYAIVVDTCGNGTPYPNAYATTFNSYSYSFLIGGQYGLSFPTLEQYILTPGSTNSLNPQPVPLSNSTTSFLANDNNLGTEFELIFTREQLNDPLNVSQPCPNITPAPSSGTSPTATATATGTTSAAFVTPTPTATPTASPSAGPTASSYPNAQPTTYAQRIWNFNFFTIDNGSKGILDSLGQYGPQDNTYPGVQVDTTGTNQYPVFKVSGGPVPTDPSAAISGGEIDTYL